MEEAEFRFKDLTAPSAPSPDGAAADENPDVPAAATILRIIESEEPNLSEIDAMVCEYLGGFTYFQSKHDCYSVTIKGEEHSRLWPHAGAYGGYCPETGKKKKFPKTFPYAQFRNYGPLDCPSFTTSRDTIKAIRPEGWYFNINWALSDLIEVVGMGGLGVRPVARHTSEELAELHCVIQAISHERSTTREIETGQLATYSHK